MRCRHVPPPARSAVRGTLLAALIAWSPGAQRAARADDAPVASPAAAPLSRIVFGSCIRQGAPQPIWDAIVQYAPDATVLLGDNVYADTEDMARMRALYAQLAAEPGFQRLRAATRLYATWDDHDYGGNDAGAEYPMRAESKRAFLDFLGEPADSPRRLRDGVYQSYVLGPEGRRVQIILLDLRWVRSPLVSGLAGTSPSGGPIEGYLPNDDPAATILGPDQWSWLARELERPAELRLIGSSIQVLAEDHPYEKWRNFPRERDRLLALIHSTGARGVVFLSGDRHDAELSLLPAAGGVDGLTGERTPNPAAYPLFDLTSSSFNAPRPWTWDVNRHRIGDVFWGANFGTVEIDWSQPDPLVTLGIRDATGTRAFGHTVPLSTLAPHTLGSR
ncbi:MAG: alkaline phosphatase D family protein [bacterium]